ncbi:uncharacterized protein Tco025E_01234 [Trypanosoma conorhini]|uniref:Uncharacterized protein n=1 Tax=Trypanosoma conorhini TaxID=83891 RepID=A0A422Q978_9TRYP|nr:uncharacterized protein Tco025E_01234 [Trypanosoma conorhini]RNF26487.1 hypothetical protein Tco025E_01234 [Trypanosoma conorhini]
MGIAAFRPLRWFRDNRSAKECANSPRGTIAGCSPLREERQQHSVVIASEALAVGDDNKQGDTLHSTHCKGQRDKSLPRSPPLFAAVGSEEDEVAGSKNVATENPLGATAREKLWQQSTLEMSLRGLGENPLRPKQGGRRESVLTDEVRTPLLFRTASFHERKGSVYSGVTWDGTQRFRMSSRAGGDVASRPLRVLSGRKSPNSILSDFHSNVESTVNLSQGSNARSLQSALCSVETTRTLINAKAVLRKHVHHSLASSSESGKTTSYRSAVHNARNEGDVGAVRPVNPLVPFDVSGEFARVSPANEGDFGDRMGEEVWECAGGDGGRCRKGHTPSQIECPSPTLSSSSVFRNRRSSSGQCGVFSADRAMISDLMDRSVEYATSEDPPDQSSGRYINRRFSAHPPQDTGWAPPAELLSTGYTPQFNGMPPFRRELGHAEGVIARGEAEPDGTELNQNGVCNSNENKGWVGIGGDAGVESDDWYARLRSRLRLDDSEGNAESSNSTGHICGNGDREKKRGSVSGGGVGAEVCPAGDSNSEEWGQANKARW